jgi:hypothetical protein
MTKIVLAFFFFFCHFLLMELLYQSNACVLCIQYKMLLVYRVGRAKAFLASLILYGYWIVYATILDVILFFGMCGCV